jgi:hypothetical protein
MIYNQQFMYLSVDCTELNIFWALEAETQNILKVYSNLLVNTCNDKCADT